MRNILYLMSMALCLLVVNSCQKPGPADVVEGIRIQITDKSGNDLLDNNNPYYIGNKITVLFNNKTYSNMMPSDYAPLPDVYISPEASPYTLHVITSETYGGTPKGCKIEITMPDGQVHTILNEGGYWSLDGERYEYPVVDFNGEKCVYKYICLTYSPGTEH